MGPQPSVEAPKNIGYRPGLVDLESCIISNFAGSILEIRHAMIEFTIFEDLLAHGTKLEMILVDANGLIEMVPIVGDETVILKFRNPTGAHSLTYVFNIYKLNKRVRDAHRTDTYMLHGISQEVVNNWRKSVNRAFRGEKASDVVSTIYREFLRPKESEFGVVYKNPGLDVEDTKEKKYWIIPDTTPFKAIEYLAQEAEAKPAGSKANNYMFYETNSRRGKTWHFRTIDSLLSQTPREKNTFYFAHQNIEITRRPPPGAERWERPEINVTANVDQGEQDKKGQEVFSYQKIIKLRFKKQFDTLSNLEGGLFFNVTETIDPIIKTFTTVDYNYDSEFKEFKHLSNQRVYSNESIYKKDLGTPNKKFIVSNFPDIYSNNDYVQKGNKADPQIQYPRVMHEFLKYDIASRQQLSNIIFEVVIPGNVDIEVGEVIKIIIPQSSEYKDFLTRENLLFNEKWLITAIRHTYNKTDDEFFTVMECVCDTYKKGSVIENAKTGGVE